VTPLSPGRVRYFRTRPAPSYVPSLLHRIVLHDLAAGTLAVPAAASPAPAASSGGRKLQGRRAARAPR
jgi:hypothetical protein